MGCGELREDGLSSYTQKANDALMYTKVRWRSMKAIFEKIWALAKPYLDTRMNDLHTEISVRFAHALIEKEEGSGDIILPFEETFEQGMKRLEFGLEKWFFTDSAKELARQEFTNRRQEKGGIHHSGGRHV